jgi:hypothetical protein
MRLIILARGSDADRHVLLRGLRIDDAASILIARQVHDEPRHAAVDVHQRQVLHALREVPHLLDELVHHDHGHAGWLAQKARSSACPMTARRLLSTVATDAARGPPSSATSPKKSPGSLLAQHHLAALLVAHVDAHAPRQDQ